MVWEKGREWLEKEREEEREGDKRVIVMVRGRWGGGGGNRGWEVMYGRRNVGFIFWLFFRCN